jgi:hypothetical protein
LGGAGSGALGCVDRRCEVIETYLEAAEDARARGSHADARFGHATTHRIEPELIRAAEDAFGYRVLPLSAR